MVKGSRSEADKLTQEPIEVILGGEKYKIPLLNIRESREWRRKYAEVTAPLFNLIRAEVETQEDFDGFLNRIFVFNPDQVIDLFFLYANKLDREKIESVANEKELDLAFKEVLKVALPLSRSLPQAIGRLSQ